MKTKLQSLSAFQSKSINQMAMNKISGGYAPTTTAGGNTCVPVGVTATGCLAYTSDTIDGATTTYNSPSEANVPC
ncbi:MAG TPA: hypothetical protein VK498_14555 [Ferruginibacter sp.]|nr:hypothetical protein [Ferruginibacter sp.]